MNYNYSKQVIFVEFNICCFLLFNGYSNIACESSIGFFLLEIKFGYLKY